MAQNEEGKRFVRPTREREKILEEETTASGPVLDFTPNDDRDSVDRPSIQALSSSRESEQCKEKC